MKSLLTCTGCGMFIKSTLDVVCILTACVLLYQVFQLGELHHVEHSCYHKPHPLIMGPSMGYHSIDHCGQIVDHIVVVDVEIIVMLFDSLATVIMMLR